MKTLAQMVWDMVAALEKTAAAEIPGWHGWGPGEDDWCRFTEYRRFCACEQSLRAFVMTVRGRIRHAERPDQAALTARIDTVEQELGLVAAGVHLRFLDALCQPQVPLPVGAARFLDYRLADLSQASTQGDEEWQAPIRTMMATLAARAHTLPELHGRRRSL